MVDRTQAKPSRFVMDYPVDAEYVDQESDKSKGPVAANFNPDQPRGPHTGEWIDDLTSMIRVLTKARGGHRDVALIDDPDGSLLLGDGRFVLIGADGHRSNWVKNGVDDADLTFRAGDAPAMSTALKKMAEATGGPNPPHEPDSAPVLIKSTQAAGFYLGAFYDPSGDMVSEGGHFVSVLGEANPDWGDILGASDVVHLDVADAQGLADAIDKVTPVVAKFNPAQLRDEGGEDGGQWIRNPAAALKDQPKP